MKKILLLLTVMCAMNLSAQHKTELNINELEIVQKALEGIEDALDDVDIDDFKIKFNPSTKNYDVKIASISDKKRKEAVKKALKAINNLPAEVKNTPAMRNIKKIIKQAK
ncbi:MAG: hypothetical protein PHD21_06645 [Flavobacteriales bacterium]|nr:hypothetical protein [Flavobacteriales bacterium]